MDSDKPIEPVSSSHENENQVSGIPTGIGVPITPQTLPVVPSQQPSSLPPSNLPPRPSKRPSLIVVVLLIIILLLVVGGGIYILNNKKSPSTSTATQQFTANQASTANTVQTKPHLVFLDLSSKTLTLSDQNLNKLYSDNYTPLPFASFTSASPEGDMLFFISSSVTDPNQQYMVINSTGVIQTIAQQAQKVLNSANGNRGGGTIYLVSSTEAVLSVCTTVSSTENNCNLELLNLSNGTTQSLLSTTAPVASDTGDSLFSIDGVTAKAKTAYLEVAGPTNLGQGQDSLFSVNLATKKVATALSDVPTDNSIVNISPDGSKIIYISEENSGSVINIVNASSGKHSTINWSGENMAGGQPLAWSPDGTKVLLSGYQSVQNSLNDIGPTTYAYIDTSSNTIVNLQTISDSAHNTIDYQGWLNNGTIIYDYETTTSPYNFSGTYVSAPQVYEQNIQTKKSTQLDTSYGSLIQVVFY